MDRNMSILFGFLSIKVAAEPELALVNPNPYRVIERCLNGVRDLDIRGWNEIRFWLWSHEKDKPCMKPFHKYYAKLTTYSDIWVQLILFCWRTFEWDDTGTEYLPKQRDCLIQLWDIVCLGDHTNDEIYLAVSNLSISLIKHSDFESIHSVIKYFSGIKGYKLSESRWCRPSEYTPTRAAYRYYLVRKNGG